MLLCLSVVLLLLPCFSNASLGLIVHVCRTNGSLLKPVGTSSFLLALRIWISVIARVVCSLGPTFMIRTLEEKAFVSGVEISC